MHVLFGSIVALFASCILGLAQAPSTGAIVRHLANGGTLLQSGNACVVLDFPFTGSFDWCVSPTEAQIQALLRREAPFQTVDAFIFTHDHVDHFDPKLVARCLGAHPETALVGTSLVIKRVKEACAAPLPNLMREAHEGEPIHLRGVKILPLKAPHSRYWDMDPTTGQRVIHDDGYVHTAYLIQLAGLSIVHGGDAYTIAFPPACTVDLLLLNRGVVRAMGLGPLKELNRRLGARHTVLIHFGPSEGGSLEAELQGESPWLTPFTGRDRSLFLPLQGGVKEDLPPLQDLRATPRPGQSPAPGL